MLKYYDNYEIRNQAIPRLGEKRNKNSKEVEKLKNIARGIRLRRFMLNKYDN